MSKGRIECIDRHFDVVSAVEFKELEEGHMIVVIMKLKIEVFFSV